MKLCNNKFFGIAVIAVIHVIAITVGIYIFNNTGSSDIFIKLAFADLGATLVVWLAGVLLKNSSVYDPYWSVAPMVIIPFMINYYGGFNAGRAILFAAVLIWGIRLTLNWAYTFKNIKVQDWRYDRYKQQYSKYWFFINLFGINIMPTVVVFLALTPAVLFIEYFSEVNAGLIAAFLICLAAIIIQLVSDVQMHKFRNCNKGVNTSGLWKVCRHPNYLGEIIMWWGIYLMLISVSLNFWYMFFAPLVNNIMFLVISVPLMEKRQLSKKPEYAQYIETTGKLLPKINIVRD